MQPRIEKTAGIKLVGMKVTTTLSTQDPASLWKAFKPRCGEIPSRKDGNFYSVQVYSQAFPNQFTPNTPFDKWAAVAVTDTPDIPEGMSVLEIPDSTFAVFIHKGPANTFPQTAAKIFGAWLPQSDYQLADLPHFEVMTPDYAGPMHPDAEEEVWIPVTPKN
ncbi:GyrI-like domain-containing protein [Marinoscillum furvescens]|uniref:AraC family transcriptional regulator n=1 Tax=Marinoscillum furvescens DSM 4134 TaxID=1122208 RepID=A0A3D9KVK4_MARFU|nr:GyrI-like domain-containing protein [Marinoscillum furvescens]RED91498.1 AraC family transcriptional regulator [Marinoscillum furvescens DSM 4134]